MFLEVFAASVFAATTPPVPDAKKAPAPDAKKLMIDCYDGNVAHACVQLADRLAVGTTATDHDRAILARHRACVLGDQPSCMANAKPGTSHEAGEILRVKRAEIDAELSDLPNLLQSARLEGRDKGFEFVHIDPKSAYEYLGFKIGDILLEINGHELLTSTQAMELFVLLRSETDFKVKLKRDGKILERAYLVVN
jgi:hypothetical protein